MPPLPPASSQVPRATALYLRAVTLLGACVLAAARAGTPGAVREGDPRDCCVLTSYPEACR